MDTNGSRHMCGSHPDRFTLGRRRFLAAAGAGVAATALGAQVPAWAQGRKDRHKLRLHILSDVHISDVYPVAMSDMRESLVDLNKAAPDPDALVIIGDLTEFGQAQDYPLLDLVMATSPHPEQVVYAIGNHEYHSNEATDVLQKRFLDYTGRRRLYTSTTIGDIPVILLGGEGVPPGETNTGMVTALLSDEQLDWFEAELKRVARKDRPTLVFLHQPPEITTQQDRLVSLLSGTPNVIFFYGHLHEDLNWYADGPDTSLLGNDEGYWRIQAPATTYIEQPVRQADGSVKMIFQADWKQGLVVDIYDDAVAVRGRDTYTGQWITSFQAAIRTR